jgi:hypothetical protein
VRSIAATLLQKENNIPSDKRTQLRDVICSYLGKTSITNEGLCLDKSSIIITTLDLKELSVKESARVNPSYKSHEQMVVEMLTTPKDIEAFVHKWRRLFVDNMQPRFVASLLQA